MKRALFWLSLSMVCQFGAAAGLSAQAPKIAVVAEKFGAEAASAELALRDATSGSGYAILDGASVRAARAFAGQSGPLSVEQADELRKALGADALLYGEAKPQGDALLVQVRLHTAKPVSSNFGQVSKANLRSELTAIAQPVFGSAAAPAQPAPAPAQPAPAPAQPAPAPAQPAPAPAQPAPAPAQPTPAQQSPTTTPAPTPTPLVPAQPAPAPQPQPTTTPAQPAPAPQVQPAVSEQQPETLDTAALAEEAAAEDPYDGRPAPSQRFRIGVNLFWGTGGFGQGILARLAIPLMKLGDEKLPMSVGAGLDIGINIIEVGDYVLAMGLPINLVGNYRVSFGKFTVGGRAGLHMGLNFAQIELNDDSITSVVLSNRFLVGANATYLLGSRLQVMAGFDAMFGPSNHFVIAGGIAF